MTDLIKPTAGTKDNLTKTGGERAQVLADLFSDMFTQEPEYMLTPIVPINYCEMLETIYITIREVQNKLKDIKVDETQGPDETHLRILNELSRELGQPLQYLFNTLIKMGKVPDMWKKANVSGIFKKSCRKKHNYRHVSFTCIIYSPGIYNKR